MSESYESPRNRTRGGPCSTLSNDCHQASRKRARSLTAFQANSGQGDRTGIGIHIRRDSFYEISDQAADIGVELTARAIGARVGARAFRDMVGVPGVRRSSFEEGR